MKAEIDQIDALLPQTQCEDCSYPGCRPYAEAIVNNNESLDRCTPGGVETLIALGQLRKKNIDSLITDMRAKQKPRQLAVIQEDICIGCTKCIKACPVDAILGGAKHMHTVISDECTGCELCVAPCPVDCIDIIPVTPAFNPAEKQENAKQYRQRYEFRNARLIRDRLELQEKRHKNKSVVETAKSGNTDSKHALIAAALGRVKAKKTLNNREKD